MSETLPELDGNLLTARVPLNPLARSAKSAKGKTAAIRPGQSNLVENSGASFSYELLRYADRWIPSAVFAVVMRAGAWVSLAIMPRERRHSRRYLRQVLGRPATLREVWRHFFAYTKMYVLRCRLAEGRAHDCRTLPSCNELKRLVTSGRPALLGTFHVGNSDLLGFLLGTFGCKVHMIRLRMQNSRDTHRLANRFGKWVTFIWVNDTSNLLFAVKQAAESGSSIAMKCDRPEHSSKLEVFDFLGERRLFPFTIYHLAILFRLPVVFCVGTPSRPDESTLHGSLVFEPTAGSKEENLARGREHFQSVLTHLETLIRADPFLWFNFTALPPTVEAAPTAGRISLETVDLQSTARV